MAKSKTSGVASKLRALPTGKRSAEQIAVIDETVAWLAAGQKTGESLPSFRSVATMLRREYGIVISHETLSKKVAEHG